MGDTGAVKYEQEVPEILGAMANVEAVLEAQAFDRRLGELVRLRVSQINQCAYCVKMQLRVARELGESDDRLDRVVVWRHVRDFSERERAALAWAEALTGLDGRADLAELRARLRAHFDEREIGMLTSAIAMINLWSPHPGLAALRC